MREVLVYDIPYLLKDYGVDDMRLILNTCIKMTNTNSYEERVLIIEELNLLTPLKEVSNIMRVSLKKTMKLLADIAYDIDMTYVSKIEVTKINIYVVKDYKDVIWS